MKFEDRYASHEGNKCSTVRLGVLLKRLHLSWRTYKTLKQENRWMPEIRANARVVMIEEVDVEAWKVRGKERTAGLYAHRERSTPSRGQSCEGTSGVVSPKVTVAPLDHRNASSVQLGYGQ